MTLVAGNITFVWIFAGVPWRRASNDNGVVDDSSFLWRLEIRPAFFIWEYGVSRGLTTDPKTRDLEFYVKFCFFCQVQVQNLLIFLYGQHHYIYRSHVSVWSARSVYHRCYKYLWFVSSNQVNVFRQMQAYCPPQCSVQLNS